MKCSLCEDCGWVCEGDHACTCGGAGAPCTMLLYRMNDTWEIMVSPGKSSKEEEFRITVMWIASQMQHEFDLRQ